MKLKNNNTEKQRVAKQDIQTTLKHVGYVFVWLCIWTPAAMILGIIIIMSTQAILFGYDDPSTPSTGRESMIAFIVATILLASVLFFTAHQMKKYKESFFLKVGRNVLLTTTSIGLISTLSIMSLTATPDDSLEPTAIASQELNTYPISHDPQLLLLSQQIGAIYVDNLDMKFADSYPQVDRNGEYQSFNDSVSHKFAYGKMTVRSGRPEMDTRRTVAHEYLHHIWYSKLDNATKDKLTSHLITLYGKDYAMQQRTDGHYSQNGTLLPTELFSFYCTESSDGYLTSYVKDTCNEFINRGSLSMLR